MLERLNQAMEYIEERLDQPLEVVELARIAVTSEAGRNPVAARQVGAVLPMLPAVHTDEERDAVVPDETVMRPGAP